MSDEICADCGKPIFGNQGSYYSKNPDEDIGRAYHSQCGDPFGVRARDAEIARLKSAIREAIDTIRRDYTSARGINVLKAAIGEH